MDINRTTVKAQAKELMKGRIFSLFLIIMVVGILTGGISAFISTSTQNLQQVFQNGFENFDSESLQQQGQNATSFLGNFSGILTIVFAPLSVGLAGLLLTIIKGAQYDIGNEFTYVFKNTFDGNYTQKLLMKFLISLFSFLWALLFIIPGIVYRYKVYFADYIMAEHPDFEWKEAIELSKKMTNGHKGELFVFDLSFILWYMLTGITFGIAFIYVSPYVALSQALYYENFKLRGLQTGEINQADFVSKSQRMAQAYNNRFGTPEQQNAQPQYQAPVQQQYQAPVQNQPYQAPQGQYQAPVQPQYQQPQYQPPVQQQYQAPVQNQPYQTPQGQYQAPVVQPTEPEAPQESFYTPPADAQQYFTPQAPAQPEAPAEPQAPADTTE